MSVCWAFRRDTSRPISGITLHLHISHSPSVAGADLPRHAYSSTTHPSQKAPGKSMYPLAYYRDHKREHLGVFTADKNLPQTPERLPIRSALCCIYLAGNKEKCLILSWKYLLCFTAVGGCAHGSTAMQRCPRTPCSTGCCTQR